MNKLLIKSKKGNMIGPAIGTLVALILGLIIVGILGSYGQNVIAVTQSNLATFESTNITNATFSTVLNGTATSLALVDSVDGSIANSSFILYNGTVILTGNNYTTNFTGAGQTFTLLDSRYNTSQAGNAIKASVNYQKPNRNAIYNASANGASGVNSVTSNTGSLGSIGVASVIIAFLIGAFGGYFALSN